MYPLHLCINFHRKKTKQKQKTKKQTNGESLGVLHGEEPGYEATFYSNEPLVRSGLNSMSV